jgi:XTP/dITP diphosphohydrolase
VFAAPTLPASRARLLLASNSRHKLLELRSILADLPVELVTPAEVGIDLDVPETGLTFHENAELKAITFARHGGMVALADDSGLEIDALDGEPGVQSKRYAGPGATDADRIALVLSRLRDVPAIRRTARFRCVIALATPESLVGTVEGVCYGLIASEPRGAGGFGYDPIFWLPDRGCTMAELRPDEKNQISHRGRAARASRDLIDRWQAEHLRGAA